MCNIDVYHQITHHFNSEASSPVPSSVAPGASSSPQRFARAESPVSLPGPARLEPPTSAVAGSQREATGACFPIEKIWKNGNLW